MKWIYRVAVVILLVGSLGLNGLQYVGSAVIDGLYSVAEGVTGVTSASSIQKKEAAQAKEKRVAQGAKLKGLQSRVNANLRRAVGRGATRVGTEAMPIPGKMFLIPAFVAMEAGFVYYDIQDQCDLLDDLNDWVTTLEFETQAKPDYCDYTPTELAKQLPNEVEFSEAIEQTSVGNMMDETGHQIYTKIEGWGQIYRDTVKIEEDSPLFVIGASINGLEKKASDSWALVTNSSASTIQDLKNWWKSRF
jgi:hypothetical protein